MKDRHLKQKGFILSELLASLSLLMMISFTLLPIITQINIEQNILFQYRVIQSKLHDEIQAFTGADLHYSEKIINVNNTLVKITFEQEDKLWKGCGTWTNAKKQKEITCLYTFLP